MRRPLAMVALLLAVIMMGWMVLSDAFPGGEAGVPWLSRGDNLTVTGRVYDVQVKQVYDTTQLWIYIDSVTILQGTASAAEADISYHLICQTSSESRPLIGSRIEVTGQFDTFSTARNPGQFNADQYYKTLGICGILRKAQITETSDTYSHVKEMLFRQKEFWREKLYNVLPEKEASVLCAMLLGDKSNLDEEIKNLYQDNGIVHILSISGLHISLIGMSLYRVLRRLGCPIPVAALVSGSLLVLYGIMTGMSVSTVRAIGMYLIRMLGELLGRTYDMLTALGIMAIIMLTAQPLYLQNGGFLLSFGSICGIGIVLPLFSAEEEVRILLKQSLPQRLVLGGLEQLKKMIMPGLSISVFTLPIQLILFYEIPVYSVLLNMLVLPFMSLVMMAGVLTLFIPFNWGLGYVSVWILRGYEWLCRMFEALPGHTWNPGEPELWQICVYYLLLGSCLMLHRAGKGKRIRFLFIAAAICCMEIRIPPGFSVTFLDVGQGDCICVRTGEETYLFDCGSSSTANVCENVLIPYLKREGIRELDAVFVSHSDSDHTNGIARMLETGEDQGITVGRLVLPDIDHEKQKEEFGELMTLAQTADRQIPVFFVGKGTTWQSGSVQFTCLHPVTGYSSEEDNSYSQCFLLECREFSMLLTGDVEGTGEAQLLEELRRRKVGDIPLLKVAHHGSRNSTSEGLLELIRPAVAVISCGQNNSYGHPHEELLGRLEATGCRIYSTLQTGAIEMWLTGDRLRISTFCR